MCLLNVYRHLSLFYIGWILFLSNRFGGNFCPLFYFMFLKQYQTILNTKSYLEHTKDALKYKNTLTKLAYTYMAVNIETWVG